MQTVKIDILNPKVLSILENLVELKLIKFNIESKGEFSDFVEKLRSKSSNEISEDEIAYEVKKVRTSQDERN